MASSATARTGFFTKSVRSDKHLEDAVSTGKRFWVSSVTGSDTLCDGYSPDTPLATVDAAIGLCAANKGDTGFRG